MTNKDIVFRFCHELWEKRNFDIIDQYCVNDARIHSPLNTKYGPMTMKQIAEKWLYAFPDLKIKWEDFIAEGDKVVCRWQAVGTHLGSFFSTSPTHKEIIYSGIHTYRVENYKIVEMWSLVDIHSILSQLGEYQSISEVID